MEPIGFDTGGDKTEEGDESDDDSETCRGAQMTVQFASTASAPRRNHVGDFGATMQPANAMESF